MEVDLIRLKVTQKSLFAFLLEILGISCKRELVLNFFRSSELKQILYGWMSLLSTGI